MRLHTIVFVKDVGLEVVRLHTIVFVKDVGQGNSKAGIHVLIAEEAVKDQR